MFTAALECVFDGNVALLKRLLAENPGLVNEEHPGSGEPYDGYFHGATLLHHVAGNPAIRPLPSNIVEVTRVLLDAGSDVIATCGGGPAQPGSAGGNVLGLIATSAMAAEFGFALDIIDLLLEYGAEIDPDNSGGLMYVTLYHTVENKGQRDIAYALYERGHPADFCYAAGLGLLEYVVEEIETRGITPGVSDRLYRLHRPTSQKATPQEIVQDAFLCACINGRIDVADYLRTSGVDLNAFRPWGNEVVTPLHGAAWAGWVEVVKLLLLAGANPTLADPNQKRTALGWALFCNRDEVVNLLKLDAANMDLVDALELDNADRFLELLGPQDVNAALGGSTPGVLLRTAVSSNRKRIVKKLIELGADVCMPNEHGKTAVDWALESNDSALIDLISRQ